MRISGVTYIQGKNYSTTTVTKTGVAIHNTANNASAKAEADYATRRSDSVSSHFYVDKTDVIQSLDTAVKAWHAGSTEGNTQAIAFELVGTNDKSRDWWLANIAWGPLGKVLATLCRTYGIEVRRASPTEMSKNPKVKAFYGHNDMRLAWGGTTHTDPGANFPWDHLFEVVRDEMGGTDMDVDDILNADKVPNRVNPGTQGQPGYNPEMSVKWALAYAAEATRVRADLSAARTEIAALAKAVEELKAAPAGGGTGVTQEMLETALRNVLGSLA